MNKEIATFLNFYLKNVKNSKNHSESPVKTKLDPENLTRNKPRTQNKGLRSTNPLVKRLTKNTVKKAKPQ